MTFFIYGTLIFQEKFCKSLKNNCFSKCEKFNISAFICTFKCQTIFEIGSSNLKKSFRKSGPLFRKYGLKEKTPPFTGKVVWQNSAKKSFCLWCEKMFVFSRLHFEFLEAVNVISKISTQMV